MGKLRRHHARRDNESSDDEFTPLSKAARAVEDEALCVQLCDAAKSVRQQKETEQLENQKKLAADAAVLADSGLLRRRLPLDTRRRPELDQQMKDEVMRAAIRDHDLYFNRLKADSPAPRSNALSQDAREEIMRAARSDEMHSTQVRAMTSEHERTQARLSAELDVANEDRARLRDLVTAKQRELETETAQNGSITPQCCREIIALHEKGMVTENTPPSPKWSRSASRPCRAAA